jgi:hypothetical protein
MTASDGTHRSSTRQQRAWARSAWVAALLVVLGGAAPVRAQLDGAAQRCIDSYHATLRLVGQETDRWGRRCLRDAERGLLDDADACLAGDSAGRIARREQRVAGLYTSDRCTGGEPIQQGAAVGIAAHRGAASALLGDLLDRPLPTGAALATAERTCRARVLRRGGEALAAVLAAHRDCAVAGMRAGSVIDAATLDAQCGTWAQIDASGGAAAALDRLAADTASACASATLGAALPGVAAACRANPTALSDCVAAHARCRACAALRTAGDRQLDCDLFDDGTGNDSCATDRSCAADVDILMLNSALPLSLRATATLALRCGAVDNGRAACDCALPAFSPVVVPAIGDLCLETVPGCPAGVLDCGPGTALDARVIADHNVGECDGNDQCRSQCTAACDTLGAGFAVLGSACERFCQGGANDGAACTESSQCPGGGCPGRSNFGHGTICNCTCADTRRGLPVQGLACAAGVQFAVELPSNGQCGDAVVTRYPSICLPLTSGEVRGRLLHADNRTNSIPFSGDDLVAAGAPISCQALAGGTLSGLAVASQFTLLDTTLGDNIGRITVTCR